MARMTGHTHFTPHTRALRRRKTAGWMICLCKTVWTTGPLHIRVTLAMPSNTHRDRCSDCVPQEEIKGKTFNSIEQKFIPCTSHILQYFSDKFPSSINNSSGEIRKCLFGFIFKLKMPRMQTTRRRDKPAIFPYEI